MGEAARVLNERYCYGAYLKWPDDERWELLEGVAYSMSPSPSWRHQGLAGEMFAQIRSFLKGKPCRVFMAPLDILLPAVGEDDSPDTDIDTVVQPDVVVICDTGKLGERAIRGAPDVVVEVLSPHSWDRDLRLKMRIYEERGVLEYWVLDPGNRLLTIYDRDAAGHFQASKSLVAPSTGTYTAKGSTATADTPAQQHAELSAVLPGFHLDIVALFRAAEN